MNCEHVYYVVDRPLYSSLAYRMFCRNCMGSYIIVVPDHIPGEQKRQYIHEYVAKANTKKDFIV